MPDFDSGFTGTQFPNHAAIGRQQWYQLFQVDVTRKRHLVVLRRPNAILNVATKRARRHRLDPVSVIQKAKILLYLDVPEVMPVAENLRIQFVEQGRQLTFARDFFITAPALQAETDIPLARIIGASFTLSR